MMVVMGATEKLRRHLYIHVSTVPSNEKRARIYGESGRYWRRIQCPITVVEGGEVNKIQFHGSMQQ